MATQLGLFNSALIEIGKDRLVSTSDDVEGRHALDDVYTEVLKECLEAGQWNHATRTVQLDADTSIDPDFGYSEVFAKPSDWVRTVEISANEDFSVPLLDYRDESTYWLAYDTPIYVRYVSNGSSYGLNLTIWPQSFTTYVYRSLAKRVCKRLTGSEFSDIQLRDWKDAKQQALNKDALNDAQPRFKPMGSWAGSRSYGSSRRDRGKRNILIG